MKAMLLAAGLGTRLRPVTDKIPKPLIPINGIPLIFYNLALLKKHGIREVVINLHHLGGQIRQLLGDGKDFGFKFHYSFEKKILGTGGGILKAKRYFKKQPFLVINGDIITDIDLKKMIAEQKKCQSLASLAVIRTPRALKAGPVYIDSKSRIVSILQKPSSKATPTLFSGLHIIDPKILQRQKPGFSCIIRQIYIPALQKGAFMEGYPFKGYWNDLGTFESWKKTDSLLKKKQLKLSYSRILIDFKEILENKKNYSPANIVEL